MDKKYTTLHFSIDFGGEPGVFCSYCGKRITPERDLDTEEFILTCDCKSAVAESELLKAQKQILEEIKNLYKSTADIRLIKLNEEMAFAHTREATRLRKEIDDLKVESCREIANRRTKTN